MEIAANIHSLPGGRGDILGLRHANVYVVVDGEAALIDAGYEDDHEVESKLEYLREIGVSKLSYIIVTHRHYDHAGGAAKIKMATGARIVAHSQEALAESLASTSVAVDRAVEDGNVLEVGGLELEMIHTPGHAPGHICIYIKKGGVLFSGDHVLGLGTTAIMPQEGSMAQYIDSLRKLLAYDIQLMCPGHGPLIGAPRRKIQELVQHRLEREEQVLRFLKQGLRAVDELVREIYPELDEHLRAMAQGQVTSHLIKLEQEGKVASSGREGQYSLPG